MKVGTVVDFFQFLEKKEKKQPPVDIEVLTGDDLFPGFQKISRTKYYRLTKSQEEVYQRPVIKNFLEALKRIGPVQNLFMKVQKTYDPTHTQLPKTTVEQLFKEEVVVVAEISKQKLEIVESDRELLITPEKGEEITILKELSIRGVEAFNYPADLSLVAFLFQNSRESLPRFGWREEGRFLKKEHTPIFFRGTKEVPVPAGRAILNTLKTKYGFEVESAKEVVCGGIVFFSQKGHLREFYPGVYVKLSDRFGNIVEMYFTDGIFGKVLVNNIPYSESSIARIGSTERFSSLLKRNSK